MSALVRDVEGLEDLASRPRRVLALFPHPDDEAYGCAGTLFREAQAGAAVALLCLTRGEASTVEAARGLSRDEIGLLRTARLEEVAAVLGLSALVVPGLPDGGLARLPLDALAAPIAAALERFKPHLVIAHDPCGVNGHADHIATHWALRHALTSHEGPAPEVWMVAYPPEVAEALKPRLLFPTPPDQIDVTLDLTQAEATAKERCLRIHEALVTVLPDADPQLLRRPPVERYARL